MKYWTILDEKNYSKEHVRLPEGETPSEPAVQGLAPLGVQYRDQAWVYVDTSKPESAALTTITAGQARLALMQREKLQEVETSLNELAEPLRSAALIEWEYRTVIERNHPLVEQVRLILGYSKEDLDEFFKLASTL